MEKEKQRNLLQKELEFYTNLIAQHENAKERNRNLPSTSSSNLFIKKPYNSNMYHSSRQNKIHNLYKLNKPDLKTNKIALKNPFVIDKFSNENKTSLYISQPSKLLPTVHFRKSVGSSKNTQVNSNVCAPIPKSDNHLKSLQNGLNKCSSKMFTDNISNVNDVKPYKKPSFNKEVLIKSDLKKLNGEMMALTEKLKIKSKNCKPAYKPSTSLPALKDIDSYRKNGVITIISKPVSLPDSKKDNSIGLNSSFKVTSKDTIENDIADKKIVLPVSSDTIVQNLNLHPMQSSIPTTIHSNINSKLHLLEKLEAVEKLLTKSNKNSTNALYKARMHPLKYKVKINNRSHHTRVISCPKVPISCDTHVATSVKTVPNKSPNYFSTNSSIMQKSHKNYKSKQVSKLLSVSNKSNHLSPRVNIIKTKYTVINKKEPRIAISKALDSAFITRKKINSQSYTNIRKNSFTSINSSPTNSAYYSKKRKTPKTLSKTCTIKRVSKNSSFYQNMRYPLKKADTAVFKKSNINLCESVERQKHESSLNVSYLKNFNQSPSDVDVDLLLELAEENKKKLSQSIPRKRLFKSNSRLINRNTTQDKAAKMIKAKYFSPYRKSPTWKNNLSYKSHKGYQRNYLSSPLKSIKNYQNKLKNRKLSHHKKIVSLGGEKFIVGSTGRTLKKLNNHDVKQRKSFGLKKSFKWKATMKTPSPMSKIMASRVLTRSINQALSASAKKKMRKINTYCMFYNRFGRCNNGVKCSFVHDPSKIAVCTRFLRGTCKTENCLFSHEINPGKMAICTFFLQDSCTKEDCPYLHEKPSSKAELCKAFVQGYCPNGKDCKKAHVLICSNFLRGVCDKGKDCIFPHPVGKNSKPSNDNQKKDEFLLETVLRYFESCPLECSTKDLVVPKRKTLPEQPSFISLTMDEIS